MEAAVFGLLLGCGGPGVEKPRELAATPRKMLRAKLLHQAADFGCQVKVGAVGLI